MKPSVGIRLVVCLLLLVEVIALLFLALYPFVDPLSGIDEPLQGTDLLYERAFRSVCFVSSVILLSGIKMLSGSMYFYRHRNARRLVAAAIPALNAVAAVGLVVSELIDSEAVSFEVPLFLLVTGSASAAVFASYWKQGFEPTERLSGDRYSNRIRNVILVVLVASISYIAVFAMWPVLNDPGYATDEDITRDENEMKVVNSHLTEVAAVVNALPAYGEASSDPAALIDCPTDSGELFQPSLRKIWTLTETRNQLVPSASADLAKMGWTVAGPDQFGTTRIEFASPAGWIAAGSFYEIDSINTGFEVKIRDARPCSVPEN